MIKSNVTKILELCSSSIEIVAASKTRTVAEILEAVDAGIVVFGENYVQEAQPKIEAMGDKVKWHLIGALQKNKVSKAVKLFDMIETVDSFELAKKIDAESAKISKVMPILIELNSACEKQKSGVLPKDLDKMIADILTLTNIKLCGLMTMGPLSDDSEYLRPFFRKAKELYEGIALKFPENNNWRFLSMGMSGSYITAIEEGANMIRIGSKIFGPR
ncbi:MAG: YggS family pyridoxal phosphate-dependent enzyme [Candidatus Omnitrophica bacterium]|nr:YggS family pyridoxal phosphate-dependent enzyme [Candidatus Omnitrophota bacterium]MDD5081138.1 YggS family pyridoxal phosphate-dependent enzyme [Candidatus Omnitrophota bacterium]MDD5441003.1 YggS family pyridoxal phosphate-dependent enzyme [Candidatus Omnitrophota bacterium]